MPEVEPTGQRSRRYAATGSGRNCNESSVLAAASGNVGRHWPTLLLKQSPDGCTIDMPRQTAVGLGISSHCGIPCNFFAIVLSPSNRP